MLVQTVKHKYKAALVASLLLLSLKSYAQSSVGELELDSDSKQTHQAVLLNTDISGSVNGLIASINVKQTFQNTSSEWVNGRYVFPLPENAAVDSFRMRIGDRVIDGLIKEKEQAQREFQAAKRSGKKAGLLKQHRPNLFSIAVANIGPNENVITELTFINQVHFDNNVFSLTLPTTITPRYIPGAALNPESQKRNILLLREAIETSFKKQNNVEINTALGWATNTDRVDDASDITPPQAHVIGTQASNYFSLSLSVNSGLPLQDVISNTHSIRTHVLSDSSSQVRLANSHEKMDSDLVLQWKTTIGNTPSAAFFQQKFNKAYYSMLMVMPPQVNAGLSLPRDVTFIIDTSGSMSGLSMRQAKQAMHNGLDYLSPNDKFNIIEFNSSYTSLFTQSESVTMSRLSSAHNMIDGLSAGGGTEMFEPLRHALNSHSDEHYLKQVIFITDGAIGNEAELFKMINKDINNTRLFTVAIGSAPNSYFMNKAADFGRGSYTMIKDLNQVSDKMAALFEKITSAVMRDISVDWVGATTVEQYPVKIPDLYLGQPLTLIVKSDKPISQANIEGRLLNTPWNKSLSLNQSNSKQTDNLDTVWARQKIASLMDQLHTGEKMKEVIKPQIIKLGVKHNIITQYTAFIAIEKTPSKPVSQNAKHHNVPNAMPKGSTMPAPQTATPATLFSLMGGLLLLLSGCLKRYYRVKPKPVLEMHKGSNA